MARPKTVQLEVEISDIIDAVLKEYETLVEVVRCAYGTRRADDE